MPATAASARNWHKAESFPFGSGNTTSAKTPPPAQILRESQGETAYTVADDPAEPFDADRIEDTRRRIRTTVVQRQGQQEFRYTLLSAYRGQCSFTRTDIPEALEAAHILPYRGTETDHPANGLLLRADIHTLFDLGLLAVDTTTMSVLLSPQLHKSDYAPLNGRLLHVPREPLLQPDHKTLDRHRASVGL